MHLYSGAWYWFVLTLNEGEQINQVEILKAAF